MNPIITLISDWRLRDPYLAMLKGRLLSALPDANLLDITHYIEFSDLGQTAFLLRQSYGSFPQGTIHLILTNVTFTSVFNPVVVEKDGHFFVGENNGIFTMLFSPNEMSSVRQYNGNKTFAIDKMVSMAKCISNNELETYSAPFDALVHKFWGQAFHNTIERKIEGSVAYIDANFNAVTNIPIQMFREVKASTNGSVKVVVCSHDMRTWEVKISDNQYAGKKDRPYLVENGLGYMEIIVTNGKVAMLFDIRVGGSVIISY